MLQCVSEFPSFLSLNNIPYMWYAQPHFICQWALGLFLPFLAVVKYIALNKSVQISVQVSAFNSFGYVPRSGIPGLYGKSLCNYLRKCHTVGCTICHSHQQCTRAPTFHLLANTFFSFSFFHDSHPNVCEVVPHCGFDLHFPNN